LNGAAKDITCPRSQLYPMVQQSLPHPQQRETPCSGWAMVPSPSTIETLGLEMHMGRIDNLKYPTKIPQPHPQSQSNGNPSTPPPSNLPQNENRQPLSPPRHLPETNTILTQLMTKRVSMISKGKPEHGSGTNLKHLNGCTEQEMSSEAGPMSQ